MALTTWKSYDDYWLPKREVLPYWRRNWLWRDDLAFPNKLWDDVWDLDRRAWEVGTRLSAEYVDVSPTFDKDGFQVSLDVSDFRACELTVKTNENSVLIEGKREEFRNGRRYITRRIARRYDLPPDHDAHAISSELSSDGILTIKVPKTIERVVSVKPTYRRAITDKKVHF